MAAPLDPRLGHAKNDRRQCQHPRASASQKRQSQVPCKTSGLPQWHLALLLLIVSHQSHIQSAATLSYKARIALPLCQWMLPQRCR
jgi:hypothetical protein